jgi:OmcA/MtrC family decaheme c-type cytochrome
MAAIDSAKAESCGTCHGDVGAEVHQAEYNKYVDASDLTLTFAGFTSEAAVAPATGFDVTLSFSIEKNGAALEGAEVSGVLNQARFYVTRYDAAAGEYLDGNQRLSTMTEVAPGDYTVFRASVPFDPDATDSQFYGYIADGPLLTHEGHPDTEFPTNTHVHLYDNVASAALASGAAVAGADGAYESAANVSGCVNCHGDPYMKHGYRDPVVGPLPDFASCKSCHYDTRSGGHEDWQYMVDQPLNWATGGLTEAEIEALYPYTANVMNDTHMAHAMEFPYPQSMSNCNTCHEDKLDRVLADENFTAETCKSCHPVQGIDAWPEDAGTTLEGDYAQSHRAPPMQYLWTVEGVEGFHNIDDNCIACHSDPLTTPPFTGFAVQFDGLHTGYDATIYNASGQKYAELYTVSIDNVTMDGNLLTVNFSSDDPAIAPELLVSLYGWDSKQFIIGSHTRDGGDLCTSRGNPAGCRMEFAPGDIGPLFTEDALSVPGNWIVTLDMAAYVPTEVLPDDIPTLIANGVIKKAEVTITPELELTIGGEDVEVILKAANETFDLGTGMVVDEYFKGDNGTVDTAKCNACHDSLASSFHDGSGRGGDGIEVCKNCHVTTNPGSHLEMASRAIDSYVHAIHSFQPFDLDDVAAADDPVEDARAAQHAQHVFPNFTIRNCEGCHKEGTYNVPDQSKSMPGVLSASWDIADRNIGTIPELVTGPASRACGGCHRARLINDDLAGELATWNAHTEAFGTLEENDADDFVIYGIIDKIMSMFE